MSTSSTVLVFPLALLFLAWLRGGRNARVKEGSTADAVSAECREFSLDIMLGVILVQSRGSQDQRWLDESPCLKHRSSVPMLLTFTSRIQREIFHPSVFGCRNPPFVR